MCLAVVELTRRDLLDVRHGEPRLTPGGETTVDETNQDIEANAKQLSPHFVAPPNILVANDDDGDLRGNHPPGPVANLGSEADVDRAARMTIGEDVRRPDVHEIRAICDSGLRSVGSQPHLIWQPMGKLKERWTMLVDALQLREIRRSVRQIT